jgi:hypothetical protein
MNFLMNFLGNPSLKPKQKQTVRIVLIAEAIFFGLAILRLYFT